MKAVKLNQFLHRPTGQFGDLKVEFHRIGVPQLALGTINVIFARIGSDVGTNFGVMSVDGGPNLGARD